MVVEEVEVGEDEEADMEGVGGLMEGRDFFVLSFVWNRMISMV